MQKLSASSVDILKEGEQIIFRLFVKDGTYVSQSFEFFEDEAESIATQFGGYSAEAIFKNCLDDLDADAHLTLTHLAGIDIAAEKTITLNLSAENLADLPSQSVADLKLIDSSGKVHPNHSLRIELIKYGQVPDDH